MTTDNGEEHLPNDAQSETGTRERIEARLDDDTLQTFHELSGGQSDLAQFRHRLATILIRYERYGIAFAATPKKERRRQLEQIEARALGLADALEVASEDVQRSLDNHGDPFETDVWDKWSFESGDPLPLKDPLVKRAQSSLTELIGAVRAELAELNRTKSEPRKIKQVALRQLIEDLAALYAYEIETAQVHAQADGAQMPPSGRYGFVKAVLDWYDPSAYFSEDALKQQIKRTLKAD